jgi:hypothetical protein
MQWTLAFLETPPVEPEIRKRLDDKSRVEALRILTRMIVQCLEVATSVDPTDE